MWLVIDMLTCQDGIITKRKQPESLSHCKDIFFRKLSKQTLYVWEIKHFGIIPHTQTQINPTGFICYAAWLRLSWLTHQSPMGFFLIITHIWREPASYWKLACRRQESAAAACTLLSGLWHQMPFPQKYVTCFALKARHLPFSLRHWQSPLNHRLCDLAT